MFPILLLLPLSLVFCKNPIAVFHGFVDSCDSRSTVTIVTELAEDTGTIVECIEVGNGFWSTLVDPFQKQLEEACDSINNNPNFQGNFDIFALSQGTLIARYIIEKCKMNGKVDKYLSMNGPQMGIGWIPKLTCGEFCDWLVSLTAPVFYSLRDKIGPAAYFRYRYNQEYYIQNNIVLKMLNNENDEKDEEIYRRFSSLEKVMMIKNKRDTVITPVESSWFEFYDFQGNEIVPLRESNFYKEDWIGVRKLDEEGKISFVEFSGEHVMYTLDEYWMNIVPFFTGIIP